MFVTYVGVSYSFTAHTELHTATFTMLSKS
jgi:hypothetical protein